MKYLFLLIGYLLRFREKTRPAFGPLWATFNAQQRILSTETIFYF